jgi:hypothetical protein
MSKRARAQRPLFDPWLDWNQLPDAVREQALDVLISLYLEFVDVSPIGEQTNPDTSGSESTRSRRPAQHGATNR